MTIEARTTREIVLCPQCQQPTYKVLELPGGVLEFFGTGADWNLQRGRVQVDAQLRARFQPEGEVAGAAIGNRSQIGSPPYSARADR